jgi:hypothetical protein
MTTVVKDGLTPIELQNDSLSVPIQQHWNSGCAGLALSIFDMVSVERRA